MATPFREEPAEEDLKGAYYSDHDLRDMYSRENTERRRAGGHTLRRHLTAAQDKKLTAQFVKLRDEYVLANNDDSVLAFAQQLIEAGKEAELDPVLVELAKKAKVVRREDAGEKLPVPPV